MLQKKVRYYSRKARQGKLNAHHTHFFLADNGTTGYAGAEVNLRHNLERHLCQEKNIPMICVLIEGEYGIFSTLMHYLSEQPPVPVVVCDGTGRAADIISFAYRHGTLRDQLIIFRPYFIWERKIFKSNGFFYKICQEFIYIKAKGFHP